MEPKHPNFTYSYHFLSEAIIIFLMAVPLLHFGFQWIPYWSYLGVATVTAAIFLIFSRLGLPYGWYLALIPVIILVFSLWDYPVILSALFSVLMVWRFIKIRKDKVMNQENAYVLYTLFLTTVMVLIVRDSELFLMMLIQFIILLFGYLLNHLLAATNKESGLGSLKFWLLIAGILSTVTLFLTPLLRYSQVVVGYIGQAFVNLLTFAISLMAAVFPDIEWFSRGSRQGWTVVPPQLRGEEKEEQMDKVYADPAVPDFLIWVLILTSVLLLLYFVLKRFKKRFSTVKTTGVKDVVSYSNLDKGEKTPYFIKKIFNSNYKKPNHPIRALIFDFEHLAARHEKGRRTYETVEEWLQRTGFDINMWVYQRVRYGNKDVSNDEANQLRYQLNRVKQLMNEKD